MRRQYDMYTAVTFTMIGVGMGAILALLMAPRALSAGDMTSRSVGKEGGNIERRSA